MMTKREILQYKNLSTNDQRTFDRWLKANAVAGLLFWVVAIAMATSNPGPREASAKSPRAIEFGAFEKGHDVSSGAIDY
jgi:hypothetical protein